MKRLNYLILIAFAILTMIVGFSFGYYLSPRKSLESLPNDNYHYPAMMEREYYDSFFASITNCKENYKSTIKGLIVNHHLLAGKFVAQGLCSVATDKPLTIILISPNHFNRGVAAITSAYDWQTPYGSVKADIKLINNLVQDQAVVINETPFELEHGVYNILPFIKRTLPNARIVPVMVKDNISDTDKLKLIKTIQENIDGPAVIIASLDFSHYLTSDEADKADAETLGVISSLDLIKVKDLDRNNKPDNVDSKPGLEIFLNLMSAEQARDFQLLAHSNSAKLIGDLNIKETTSYIVGNFSIK